jgi:cytochrome P450
MTSAYVSLTTPAFFADPYPVYANLREADPCHWNDELKSWVLTRYADIRAVLTSPGMSSERLSPFFAGRLRGGTDGMSALMHYLSRWMVFRDPPEHTRLRKLSARVFNASAMQGMRTTVDEISNRLLRRLEGREQFDFIHDYAGPLPCLVIMAMLGVPSVDLDQVKRLSDEMALFIGSSRTGGMKYGRADEATAALADYFRALIAARRANPQDDLVSRLIVVELEGDRLSEDELIATCMLLLFAGHETTTNLIANGLLALLKFPEEMRLLKLDPTLSPEAVEELLRYDGPSGAQVRIAAEPYELHGRTIEKGDRVFLMLNAANRDEAAWPDANSVKLGRDGPPHLAFGFGAHICLGFPLARLEGAIAFPHLLARFRDIRVDEHDVSWHESMVFRGMREMPVEVSWE